MLIFLFKSVYIVILASAGRNDLERCLRIGMERWDLSATVGVDEELGWEEISATEILSHLKKTSSWKLIKKDSKW